MKCHLVWWPTVLNVARLGTFLLLPPLYGLKTVTYRSKSKGWGKGLKRTYIKSVWELTCIISLIPSQQSNGIRIILMKRLRLRRAQHLLLVVT